MIGPRTIMTPTPAPRAFKTAAAFRAWLEKHHATESELVLGLYKVHAAHRGLTYAQALDEALCFGWIDGVLHRLDEDSFSLRFTPRKPKSIWSRRNVAHVERLKKAGKMTRAGLAAFEAKDDRRLGVYSFEQQRPDLSPAFVKAFRADAGAWERYQQKPPSYRRATAHWVMSAKREETRARRLAILVDCTARGVLIPPLAAFSTSAPRKTPRRGSLRLTRQAALAQGGEAPASITS
jgi:uncharacterized protein YdeI (YjbR/CyaY-like superfamily)